jgi:hypothetical protein
MPTWNAQLQAGFVFVGIDTVSAPETSLQQIGAGAHLVLDPMIRERIAITRRGAEAHQPGEEDVADIGSGLGNRYQ